MSSAVASCRDPEYNRARQYLTTRGWMSRSSRDSASRSPATASLTQRASWATSSDPRPGAPAAESRRARGFLSRSARSAPPACVGFIVRGGRPVTLPPPTARPGRPPGLTRPNGSGGAIVSGGPGHRRIERSTADAFTTAGEQGELSVMTGRCALAAGVGQATRPRRNPTATAWARSRAPSLRNSRRAWVLIVSSDRNSSLPISPLD